jgi:hypothetical protein
VCSSRNSPRESQVANVIDDLRLSAEAAGVTVQSFGQGGASENIQSVRPIGFTVAASGTFGETMGFLGVLEGLQRYTKLNQVGLSVSTTTRTTPPSRATSASRCTSSPATTPGSADHGDVAHRPHPDRHPAPRGRSVLLGQLLLPEPVGRGPLRRSPSPPPPSRLSRQRRRATRWRPKRRGGPRRRAGRGRGVGLRRCVGLRATRRTPPRDGPASRRMPPRRTAAEDTPSDPTADLPEADVPGESAATVSPLPSARRPRFGRRPPDRRSATNRP